MTYDNNKSHKQDLIDLVLKLQERFTSKSRNLLTHEVYKTVLSHTLVK